MAYVSPFEDAPVADEAQAKEASGANDNVLARSLRGGIYGAGSQLLSTGAGIAEAVGADNVGAGLHKRSQSLRDMAALPGNAARVGSYEQLSNDFSVDNALEYAGGLVGGSLPATALGIAGGLATGGAGLVPAMLGAGAATLPLNMGEVIQKQQADPQAMQQGAGQRALEALGGGLGASAVESLVPGLVGRQVLGKGLANLGKESVKQMVGRNALDIPLEGLTEGTGTAIKQYAANQDKELDWNEIKEGAIGGAAAGSVFSGVGTAADLVQGVAPKTGEALSSVRTSINERLRSAKDAAGEKADAAAASPAGKKVKSAFDDISEMVTRGKTKFDDTVDKMMNGGLMGVSDEDVAKSTPERVQEFMAQSAKTASAKVQEWGDEMLSKMVADDPRRQAVVDAMAKGGERAGQAAMAGLKKAWDGAQAAGRKVDDFVDAVNNGYTLQKNQRARADVDVDATEVPTTQDLGYTPGQTADVEDVQAKPAAGSTKADRDAFMANNMADGMSKRDAARAWEESQVKKSEDYSGVEQAILKAMTENGLSKRRPDLFEDRRSIGKLAGGLRQVIDQITTGQLSPKVVKKLTNLLGDDTDGVINSLRRAVKGDLDAGEAETFFTNLNAIRDAQQTSEELNKQLKSLMNEEQVKNFGSGYGLMEVADLGLAHARGELINSTDANRRTAKERTAADIATNAKVRELFVQRFGDKADAALDIIGKHAGVARTKDGDFAPTVLDEDGNMREAGDASFNEKGERQSAEDMDVVYVGAGKDDRQGDKSKAELMMHPDLFKSSNQDGLNRGQQAMMNARARFEKNGGDPRTVRFEYAEGSTTHGYVVAERAADPDGLTEAEVNEMRLDTKARAKSPDRIEIPASEKTGGKPVIIDSWKVAHVMHGRLERGALDNNSTPERMARMFIEGVARLTEKYGTKESPIVIPDGVRIARLNGKDLTWGEAQKLGKTRRTAKDRAYDRNTEQMNDARKELKTLEAGDDARRFELESLIQGIEADREKAKAEELGLRTVRGSGGKSKVVDVADSNGREELSGDPMNPDKAGNIHDAARRLGGGKPLYAGAQEEDGGGEKTGRQLMADQRDTRPNEKLINKSNMDGSGHFVKDRTNFLETMRATARDMARVGTAGAKAMGTKLEKLLRSDINLSQKDQDRMLALTLPEVSTARKAEILSELTEKYADVLRKRGPQKIGKVIAGKEQKTPEYEGETESDDYSSSEPYFDAPLGEPAEEPSAATVTKPAVLRAPVTMLEKAVAQRMKALTPQSAAAHESWAQKELASGRARNGDEAAALNSLIETARGTREGSPDPKSVAAKKAAFLSRAASGDKALLAELASSTDAKGLQRAANTLADRAGDIARVFSDQPTDAEAEADAYAARVRARISKLANEGNIDWRGDKDKAFKGYLKMLRAAMKGEARGKRNLDVLQGMIEQYESLPSPKLNAVISAKVKTSARAPLGWYMDAIAADKDTSAVMRVIAEAVAKIARGVPVIGLPTDQMSGANGLYHSDSGKLNVVSDNNLNLASIILHEGVHAATANAVVADPALHAAIHALLEHVVKHDSVVGASYGVTNTLEFLAEGLSNEGFQARLKKIPASGAVRKYLGENVANAWEGFVALVRQALKMRPQDQNALMQLLELSGRAMQAGSGHTANLDTLLSSPIIATRDMNRLIGRLYGHGMDAGAQDSLQELERLVTEQGGGTRIQKLVLELSGIWAKNNPGVALDAASLEDIFDAVATGLPEYHLTASKVVNARLSELVQDPDVAYGLQTPAYSAQATDPNNTSSINSRDAVKAYVQRVLGTSVQLAWAKFTHAGEFQRMKAGDIIRLSVHALDPMSTAYHESLHAFIAQLKDAGAHDVVDVLFKAANAPHVVKYLNDLYKDQPAVLRQLKDPEERAAYMYQAWAANPKALMVGPAAKSVLQRITDLIRSVLGIWSNDQRALHILGYFNSGEYAQAMGTPNAAHRAMMDGGRNKAIEVSKSFTEPLGRLADALVSTGDARLRDTNIPALRELADLIKRQSTEEGGDQGFIPRSRMEATKRLSAMAGALAGFEPAALKDALEGLQRGVPAATAEGQQAADKVKAILAETKRYMEFAGVNIGDLGPDYFPRVWDTHYISQNEQALRDMLEPYVRSGEFKGNTTDFIRNLTSRQGNEFGVETSMPGMQFKKARGLDFLKAADVAPFLEKDLMGTMVSYISQATRRAEWDRRLGWDDDARATKLELLLEAAKRQGATPAQLDLTNDYLKGVDGTLGDHINPQARRLMGNMIVYQNVRLLPMAMFSMLIDPMGVLVRGGTISDAYKTFKRGMASIPETYGRKTAQDEATRLAELVGVIDSAVLNHVMSDVYTQGMVGGTARKINNLFFKYNMVEGLTRSFRVGASEAAMSFLARHADLDGRHSRRWMAELGLEAGDIIKMPDGRVALTAAEGLNPAQIKRVHAAINQWVDGAMLRPDAADKPIWMNDPHYALISHLKQFVFAFQKTILNRMVHELRNGNYTPAMALASYVPMMIAADTAKGLIQGGGDTPEWKKDWGVADYVGHGIQRAGLFGVGQFGVDVVEDTQRGGVGFGALAGPTLEQFSDAVQMLGGEKQFGPMLLKALPANALYRESFVGAE